MPFDRKDQRRLPRLFDSPRRKRAELEEARQVTP